MPGDGRIVIVKRWDRRRPKGGTAVVIDVIRFSTTLCALIQTGRNILVAPDPDALMQAAMPAASWPAASPISTPFCAYSSENAKKYGWSRLRVLKDPTTSKTFFAP